MPKNITQIAWVTILLGFTGMGYYLSLLVGVPFLVAVAIVAVAGYVSYKRMIAAAIHQPLTDTKHNGYALAIVAVGAAIITNKVYYLQQQYGLWDAYNIWNYHAKYLMSGSGQSLLFRAPDSSHPSYPLFLPSVIAFCWRLTGHVSQLMPYLLSFFTTLLIPVTIFLALYRRNMVVAGGALLLLAVNEFYLERAIAQYADLPLGFLYMLALIFVAAIPANKKATAIVAALLGCCMWMKNEGIMLSALFILFNIRTLLGNGRWKYFASGIAFPLLVLAVFKAAAPPTDIIKDQSSLLFGKLADPGRYELIANSFAHNFNNNYFYVKAGLILYTMQCIAERRWPQRNVLLLLACVGAYAMVYVATPRNLEWHLETSADRVLLQLVPAFVYMLASNFCRVRVELKREEQQM